MRGSYMYTQYTRTCVYTDTHTHSYSDTCIHTHTKTSALLKTTYTHLNASASTSTQLRPQPLSRSLFFTVYHTTLPSMQLGRPEWWYPEAQISCKWVTCTRTGGRQGHAPANERWRQLDGEALPHTLTRFPGSQTIQLNHRQRVTPAGLRGWSTMHLIHLYKLVCICTWLCTHACVRVLHVHVLSTKQQDRVS
jgi:hypothetical protein